jgi:hypothetical protein
MSVSTLMDGIAKGTIVLPAIQRDFVWNEDRIEKLFDSLFRGYPIGVVMLWDTHKALQYREFDRDYLRGRRPKYSENVEGRHIQLVLDGQQRLTSLYTALHGSIEGKLLHFDVLSGRQSDNTSEEKFRFKFLTREDAQIANKRAFDSSDTEAGYYIAMADFAGASVPGSDLRHQIVERFNMKREDDDRLIDNFKRPMEILIDNGGLLQEQIIDQGLPQGSAARKSVFDILEIFMRINTQGINLSRSDLILSMLRLHWPEATEKLPDFIREINVAGGIEIDSDFAIRCIFSVAGLGTKLDIGILRTEKNVELVKEAYDRTTTAIRSVIDFVQNDGKLRSRRLINGLNTLVPFVNYLARKPNSVFTNEEKADALRALYLIAFSGVLAKHSDSRSGALIRDALGDEIDQFPYARVATFVRSKTYIDQADIRLFGNHIPLALALVQGLDDSLKLHAKNFSEVDHIFPRSLNGEEELIDDIGNYWYTPRHLNRNKSNKPAKEYFDSISNTKELSAALIYPEEIANGFESFVRARRDRIVEKLKEITNIKML